LEKKKKEFAEFEAKYKIKVRRGDEVMSRGEALKQGGASSSSSQGVLVGDASST
jgi:prefoldin subunit 2